MLIWTLGEGSATEEWLLKHTICNQYFIEHPLWSSIDDSTPFSVYAFHPSSDLLFVGNLSGVYSFDRATKRLENIFRTGLSGMPEVTDLTSLLGISMRKKTA
ncbi:hypothetical protein FRX31_008110 [Thalictrum thalictroides]|uniref:Uncharacterized protein n=1 Tax=Thalictrum thalictroides TaxID=46969 RepID=A0A7J6WZN5_THATH|nr:hypothetical protein FRX31_008110 [Thalictrum thalictroides]